MKLYIKTIIFSVTSLNRHYLIQMCSFTHISEQNLLHVFRTETVKS